jgi:uncharacterized protein
MMDTGARRVSAFLALAALAAGLGACVAEPVRGPLVTVTASAEARTVPDLATVNTGVVSRGATARAAQDAQAQRMTAVMTAVKALGVADADVQTSQIGLSPLVDWSDGRQRITGYESTNMVSIRVKDMARISDVVDAVVADGGNRLDGIAFSMDDSASAEQSAYADAVRKARQRADAYAAGAGLKVHRVISISEGTGSGPVPVGMPMAEQRVAMDAAAASTPVSAGQISTGATVTAVFELR